MENKLSNKQIKEYKDAFQLFDKDKDGKINATELGAMLEVLGQKPTIEQLKEMIEHADTNGNGTIEFTEFLSLMVKMEDSQNQMQELQNSFGFFDKNGDGFITATELNEVLNYLGTKTTEDQLNDMIQTADTNRDGKVSYEEFVRMMLTKGNN